MSWDEQFASHYNEWSAGMTDDVPFYVSLAVGTDGPLVELAIGNGRVAIPVALATGRSVIGIDSSPAMLAQAQTAAAKAGVTLDLREGRTSAWMSPSPVAVAVGPLFTVRRLRRMDIPGTLRVVE